MLNTPFSWNDINIARAKELYEKGYSYNQMAAVLGTNRGSISGFANRNRNLFPKRGGRGKPAVIVVANTKVRFDWGPEAIFKASEMWKEGKLCREIGLELGCSQTSVESFVQRHREHFPIRELRKPSTPLQRVLKAHRDAEDYRAALEDGSAHAEPVMPLCIAPISRHLSLTDLTDCTCKWPIGDPLKEGFHFCGSDSRSDSPYCNYHTRIAYVPRASSSLAREG